jgi:hypothetical protein
MMSRGALALLAVSAVALSASIGGVACTRNNLEYNPFGTSLDGGNGRDLAGVIVDLAGQPTPRDLATVNNCQADERTCQGNASAGCTNGTAVVDRTCPSASMCVDGYCEPPPPSGMFGVEGRPCVFNGSPTESACTMTGSTEFSCQPFVVDAQNEDVEWVCARAVGMKGRGDACTTGAECRSGFCGSNGTCFRACVGDRDCNSASQRCADVKIVVEGIEVQERSCIPR